MMVRDRMNWWRMLFSRNGSALRSVIPQLPLMLSVSSLALLTDGRIVGVKIALDTLPLALVGVSLAILLCCRNNALHARRLEARRIWGRILIAARALTAQAINHLPSEEDGFARKLFARRLSAFVYALKHQLRGTDPMPELARYLDQEELAQLRGVSYIPVALLDLLRMMLAKAARRLPGREEPLWTLDAQVGELAAAVGGCERIGDTPIRLAYGVLTRRTVYLYCLLLPFGLVDAIGIAAPPISVLVACTLSALEAIAQEIAEPFGAGPNCRALHAMARDIERLHNLYWSIGCAAPIPHYNRHDCQHKLQG